MQSALPHAAPPAPAAGGGGQEREGVRGAASGARGWGGTPGPAGAGTQGLWGGLTQPSLTVELDSRSVTLPRSLQPRIGAVTTVTLPVVNCPSRRQPSSSRLSSSLGKHWELGRRSGSVAQGLGSSGALVAHPRGDQGPERSTFVEGWGPTHSQVREGVKIRSLV